jgi:hypothetical protein
MKNVKFRNIPVLGEGCKYVVLFKYLLSMCINLFILLLLNKKSVIVFNYNNLFSLKIMNSLNNLLGKRIIIFCHGELELLSVYSNKLGLQAKILKRLAINFFDNENIVVSEKLRFIVLGDCILENLKKRLGNNMSNKFFSIDLPYIFKENNNNELRNKTINFGTIGVVNKNKNMENIIDLTNIFSEDIDKGRILFSITGPILVNKRYIFNANIDVPDNNNKELKRDEYNKRLGDIDYFIFFYDHRSYNYTASGSVFDVINFEKPMIALKNKYFEYLFRKYGEFGVLVNSIDEMKDLIREIINNGFNLQYDFNTIKRKLSHDKIAKELNSIIMEDM